MLDLAPESESKMRIHTNENTWSNLFDAARVARVTFHKNESFDSSIRESGFDITLRGESRRFPNYGTGPRPYPLSDGGHAATYDQWGVFLGHLFNIDPAMVCGTPKRPDYASAADFEFQTDCRFADGWPEDAHGDHSFRGGRIMGSECTKCTAIRRWAA